MTAKRKFQIATDMMMTVMLPLLMAYQRIGEAVHEWIGICMFLLFLTHHLLNRHWYGNLLKGRYNRIRIMGTVIDLLLFIIMVLLAISGVIISKHIFTFLHTDGGIGRARTAHLLASYWGFVLMSIHLGFHWNMVSMMMKRVIKKDTGAVKSGIAPQIIVAVICSYGVYAFAKQELGTYLFLKSEFVFFDFSKPIPLFFVDYIAIMILFGFIGKQLGERRTLQNKEGSR